MKPLMNSIFALFLSLQCFAQCYESSLFLYSETVKRDYENHVDSLPYQSALSNYFNDPQNHYSKNDCGSNPEYFFQLTKAEFLIKDGKYSEAIKLLEIFLSEKSDMIEYLVNDYLQALLLKETADSKLGNTKIAQQVIDKVDSLSARYSKYVSKSTVLKIKNTKAILELNNDHYEEAECYLKPIFINIPSGTKEDAITYIDALLIMGELQLKLNKEDSAYIYFERANLLIQKFYQPDHFKYAALYLDFANYYKNAGQFGESENYLQRAKTIFTKKIGTEHPDYANILRMLANLYRRTGRFDLAENNFNESLRILIKLGLENNSQYAITLTNLGSMNLVIAKRKEAEKQFLLAKTNMELNEHTTDLDYVCTLEHLANLYYNQLKLEDAETIYDKTLKLRSAIQGENHRDYAECLNSLGNIYQRREQYLKAESFYKKAIAIVSDLPINKKKACPHFYNNLALLYSKTNQYAKAESLFLEVKVLYENQFGKMNRTYQSLLDNLAELYSKMNNSAEATNYHIQASKLRKRIIYDSFRYLAANEVEEFMQRFRRGIANFNSYLLQSNQVSDSLLIEAYENELFYKGFMMNYHLELTNMIAKKPILNYLSDSIKMAYNSIAKEYAKFPLSSHVVDSLQEIAHKFEKQLSQKTDGYKELIRKINYEDFTKTLKPKEAIVEIMYLNLNAESGRDHVSYAAMIIPYGKKVPIFVPLCSEEEIKELLTKSNTLNAEYANGLYSSNSRGMTPIEKNKKNLYDLIWKKIEIHLTDIKTIYYTPAGLLHKINIQAIPINNGVVVGACYDIIQLTNSRQLVNIKKKRSSFRSALMMGGIQYDNVQSVLHYDPNIEAKSRGESEASMKLLKQNYWPELSNTLREIVHLSDLFHNNNIRNKKYAGSDATEETFKKEINSSVSPGIIHIATHGYFFPESNKLNDPENNEKICPFMNSKDPMMRSGLILAYGNYAWQHSEPMPGHKEDGILTAAEISQMNLQNTELAVLSACETGLGDIKGPEGVYGLQRAFKIAGVHYLIMSLWQIPDYQTEELMMLFYTNLLKQKLAIPKAFKKAQMEMKNKYHDPYFWAGFVLVQ